MMGLGGGRGDRGPKFVYPEFTHLIIIMIFSLLFLKAIFGRNIWKPWFRIKRFITAFIAFVLSPTPHGTHRHNFS